LTRDAEAKKLAYQHAEMTEQHSDMLYLLAEANHELKKIDEIKNDAMRDAAALEEARNECEILAHEANLYRELVALSGGSEDVDSTSLAEVHESLSRACNDYARTKELCDFLMNPDILGALAQLNAHAATERNNKNKKHGRTYAE
jgi:hypothetical protein